MALFILSRIFLLTLPNSDLVGLIKRHAGLFWKLSLWSFKEMNDSLGASDSTRSSNFRVWAKTFTSVLICFTASAGAFLYLVLLFYVFHQQCIVIAGIHFVKVRSFVCWYVQVAVLVDG